MNISKNETVRARVKPELKRDVEVVLEQLGLSMSEAIVLFLSQVRLKNGLPFAVQLPERNIQAMRRLDNKLRTIEQKGFEPFDINDLDRDLKDAE